MLVCCFPCPSDPVYVKAPPHLRGQAAAQLSFFPVPAIAAYPSVAHLQHIFSVFYLLLCCWCGGIDCFVCSLVQMRDLREAGGEEKSGVPLSSTGEREEGIVRCRIVSCRICRIVCIPGVKLQRDYRHFFFESVYPRF